LNSTSELNWKASFHKFDKKSTIINFVESLRKIQGAQINSASTIDKTINNISNSVHGLAATITVFEAKLINILPK